MSAIGNDRASRADVVKEMENTPDGDDADRGRTGPFPIRTRTYVELTPSLRGFIDAAMAEGFTRARFSD